jgi:Protein of unknown function (DUF3025)
VEGDATRIVPVNATADWSAVVSALARTPYFASIENTLRVLHAHCRDWPALSDLQAVLDAAPTQVTNARGTHIRLGTQDTQHGGGARSYAACIYARGVLPTRENNWHDLFNALVWACFPLAKAALNAHQFAAQAPATGNVRSPTQDALTLFDECGVIVASCDPQLLSLVRGFAWKELFWHNRQCAQGRIEFLLFGHGLMEQMLCPYVGLTGKAVLLDVPGTFFELPFERRMRRLDTALATLIADARSLQTPRDLAPLPILGVPGWTPDNAHESFYDNAAYFRPGRRGAQ